jgi:hypothetical protein
MKFESCGYKDFKIPGNLKDEVLLVKKKNKKREQASPLLQNAKMKKLKLLKRDVKKNI